MAHTEFLHAANALVGFVAIATADGLTGGAASALTALLSGNELLKSYRAPPALQIQIAGDIAARCDNFHFTPDQRRIFAQMVEAAPLSANEITAAARDPAAIAQAMLARMPVTVRSNELAQKRFCDLIEPFLAHWLADTKFCDTLRPTFESHVAQRLRDIDTKQDQLLDGMAELKAMLIAQAQRDQPQLYAQHTEMLIGLARNYATGPVTDFASAYSNLENALRVYDQMRRENAQPHNAAIHLDAVLARVQTLNEAANFVQARAELVLAEAAAQDRIAEETSGLTRIYDRMVAQAALQNAPQDAADALLKRLALDTTANPFAALRILQDEWYTRYQTHGVPFDGLVALALARETLARAGDDWQRGAAQIDLGNMLQVLGQRAGDDALLAQSVDAYRAALRVYSETDTPQDWAMTQNNLGIALQIMGQRAGDDGLLRQSLDAYRAALRVYSETDTPQVWATTQNNLGNTLQIMGQRAGDDALLREATGAYRAALRVRSETDTPQDWASTQNNLGGALRIMGQRAGDDGLLREATGAYRAALQVYSETDTPQDWAKTQNNLGFVLKLMGQRAGDDALLSQAKDAYHAALRVRSETDTPQDWAETTGNLGWLYLAFFDLTANRAHLTAAQTHALAARAVYERLGAAWYLQKTDTLLAEIARRFTL